MTRSEGLFFCKEGFILVRIGRALGFFTGAQHRRELIVFERLGGVGVEKEGQGASNIFLHEG